MSQFDELDTTEVALKNRKVELDKVREVEGMLAKLREAGVSSKSFELTPPFKKPQHRPMNARR